MISNKWSEDKRTREYAESLSSERRDEFYAFMDEAQKECEKSQYMSEKELVASLPVYKLTDDVRYLVSDDDALLLINGETYIKESEVSCVMIEGIEAEEQVRELKEINKKLLEQCREYRDILTNLKSLFR